MAFVVRVACVEPDGTPVPYPCFLDKNGHAGHGVWGKRDAKRFQYEAEAWDFAIWTNHVGNNEDGTPWCWVEDEHVTTCKGELR